MIEHFCWEFVFVNFLETFCTFYTFVSFRTQNSKTCIELSAMPYYPVLELVQLFCRFAMLLILVTEDWLQTALNFSNALISSSTSNWICRNHRTTATSVTSAFAVYSTMFFVFVVHFLCLQMQCTLSSAEIKINDFAMWQTNWYFAKWTMEPQLVSEIDIHSNRM